MTTAVPTSTWGHDARVIGWVSIAHTLSHFFQLILPPFFPLIVVEFGLSYAAMGLVMTVFFVVSGLAQTPAGFMVDRFGARRMIVAGLICMASGPLIASMAAGLPLLVLAAALGGLGNSVFHPADLALINRKVSRERLGHAFSIHNVGGSVGWVCAPLLAATFAQAYGWRAAVAGAAIGGLAFAALFAMQGVLSEREERRAAPNRSAVASDAKLLLSTPVLLCFMFFCLQAGALTALTTFAPTAFARMVDAPLVFATGLLTTFLIGGIVGTLGGGWFVARASSPRLVAAMSLVGGAALLALVATGWVPTAMLWIVFALAGALTGCVNPSRDVLVGEIAPAAARGKVYGFVYSGLDAGSAVTPPMLGWFIDHGMPATTFAFSALCLLAAVPTVVAFSRGRAARVHSAG